MDEMRVASESSESSQSGEGSKGRKSVQCGQRINRRRQDGEIGGSGLKPMSAGRIPEQHRQCEDSEDGETVKEPHNSKGRQGELQEQSVGLESTDWTVVRKSSENSKGSATKGMC